VSGSQALARVPRIIKEKSAPSTAMTDAERSRRCYWTNPAYRERKKAQGRAWYRAHRKLVLSRQRDKSRKEKRRLARLAEKWISERVAA
jgi:hypothetical protein